MRKFIIPIIFIASLFLAVSCGPSVYTLAVEMRQPSNSGLDLGGKDIAVVYIDEDDTSSLASKFNKSFAEGLLLAVDDHQSGSDDSFIYRLPGKEGVDYYSKDTLVSLVMQVDADVVFLIDKIQLPISIQNRRSGNVRSSAHVYDSMDKNDKVYYFGASTFLNNGVDQNNVSKKALKAGQEFSASFKPNWKLENYPVLYYSSGQWLDATLLAYEYKWKEAMDLWLSCLDTDNMLKRSCAAYDIALACHILGDNQLALEWLDSSDSYCKVSVSDALRTRVMQALRR